MYSGTKNWTETHREEQKRALTRKRLLFGEEAGWGRAERKFRSPNGKGWAKMRAFMLHSMGFMAYLHRAGFLD